MVVASSLTRDFLLVFFLLVIYVAIGCTHHQEQQLAATDAIIIDEISDHSKDHNGDRSLTSATLPTEVYIGFVYPQFLPIDIFDDTSVEQQNYDGSQYLAAFLMAVREINNKTDGLYDDVLANTTIKFAVRDTRGPFIYDIDDATELSLDVFNKTGVKIVVGAASNSASSAIAQVFNDFKVNQVAYASTGSFLSYVGPYPYYFRTCMDDAFEGYALADIAYKYYKWDIISIFSSSDSFGTDGFLQFSLRASELGIQIRSIHQFRAGTEDLTYAVNEAISFGSQVFFLFLNHDDAAKLLATGYKLGLFREGIQILGNHAILDRQTLLLLKDEYDVPVQEVLKGAISLNQSYGDANSEKFQQFVNRWRSQNDTIRIDPLSNQESCGDDTDDDGYTFLYKKKYASANSYKCTGLRFQDDFESDGSNIAKFALYAYDAVIAAAVGLNKTIYQEKLYDLSDHDYGDYLNFAMSYNYSASGVTGDIVFRLGDNTGYGFGDREIGQVLDIINFQPDLYCPINAEGGIGIIGTWDIVNGHNYNDVVDPVYNTNDNSLIKSKPPPKIINIAPGVQVMLIIFGVLCVLVVAVSALILYTFRAKKIVKVFQPLMLGIILGGSIFCAAKLFNISASVSDATCKLDIFFGHLAFTLSFGGMLLKQWRVHMIVNSAFRKVKITTSYIVRLACVLVFAVIVYLAIYAGAGDPHESHKVYIIDKLQEGWHPICVDTYPEFATTIYAIEAALLIYGARLCWVTKDVPDALNDSKPIAASMSVIILICGLVFPIVFLLPLTPESKTIITGVGFFLASMFTTAILILPKAYMLFQGADLDHKMNIVYPKTRGNAKITDKEENIEMRGDSGPQYATNVKIDPASKAKRAENIAICKAEIEKWNHLLLQLQTYELNQVNTNSNSSYSKNSSAAVSSHSNPDEEIALVGGAGGGENDDKNDTHVDTNADVYIA